MASSTVKGLNVEITANLRGLTTGFKQAESKMKAFGQRVDKFGRSLRNVFSSIFAVGGTGAAIVTPFVSFESQMNRVKAITGLTGQEFDKVRKKALNLGKTTELTATEAAKGFVQLFKKGQTLTEALSGIDTVLGLVTAGELSAAEASKIASAAFKVFAKSGETFVSLGDKMAKTSVKSGVDVKDFGLLISKAGNEAANAGVGFSELSAAFGVLRDQAVLPSEAATALRNILQRSSGRSAKALQQLDDLKLNFFDNTGKFVGFAEAFERFNKATENLNAKEIGDLSKTLFGSRAAGKALGLRNSVEEIRNLKNEIDGAKGTLSEFRKAILEGLPGGLKLMVSALEQAAISLSESFSKELEIAATAVKDFANFIAELSPTTKKWIAGISALGAAILLAAVSVGVLHAAFKLLFLGVILKAIGKFTIAIGVNLVGALIGADLAAIGLKGTMKLLWSSMLAPLLKVAGILLLIPATFLAVIIVIEKVSEAADRFGKFLISGLTKVVNFILTKLIIAFSTLNVKLDELAGTKFGKALKLIGLSTFNLAKGFNVITGSLESLKKGMNDVNDDVQKSESIFGKLAKRAKTTRIEINRLVKDATGFDFSKIGEMIFGKGDDSDRSEKGNNQKKKFTETKTEAMSLMTVIEQLIGWFDKLNDKMSGKSNGFSTFMKGIAKDLEDYKKQIGTVQEQVSQIIINSIQTMANGIGEIFAKTIVDGKSFFKSAKELIKSFARQFIQQVVAMIAQLLILAATQALVNAVQDPISGNAKNQSAIASAGSFAASAGAFVSTLFNGITGDLNSLTEPKKRQSFGNDFGNNIDPNQKKTTQTIILELDGRQLTKSVVENLPSVVRTGSGTIRSS